jgi:hypothetical protein
MRKWRENGENCIMRSFVTCVLDQIYNSDDQIKEDEMGGACSIHGKMRNS